MRAYVALMLIVLLGGHRLAAQSDGQTNPVANVASSPQRLRTDSDPATWLFPVEKLDEHLPDWLHIGGEYRNRLEGPVGIGYASTQDFYSLNRLRINATIQATSWLGFHGEVQDSQIFFNHHIPNANPYEDKWTLWEAYPQVGNSETGWIDALAGREVLRFGDERAIGPSDWLNVGRTFNAARINIHHAGYKVSIFASSVVPGDNSDLHNGLPGNNLYGAYGSMQNVIPKASFEPYLLWRVAPSSSALPETLGRGHLNEVTMGLHTKGTLPSGFEYDTEFDGQTGSLASSSISAWAGYVEVGKRFSRTETSPLIFVEGNYASGTKNPAASSWHTFDQIYPSNHDKLGFADLVGRRNIEQFRIGVEEEPTKKWKVKQQFEDYWLATTHDNFYASSGAVAVPAHPGASPHIGSELDVIAEYSLNRGMNFGFGYGRLFAGRFLSVTTAGQDYAYPFAYFEHNFSRSGFHFPVTPNRPH